MGWGAGPIMLVSGHPLNWHASASSLFLNLERSLRNAGANVTCLHSGDMGVRSGKGLSKIRMPMLIAQNVHPKLK